MDHSLKKTATNGSESDRKLDGAPLTVVISTSSTVSSRAAASRFGARTASTHSLLGIPNAADLRRKPHIETDKTPTDRASISMPPPLTKPTTDRRLSASVIAARSPRSSSDGPRSPPGSVRSLQVDERQPFINTPSPQVSTTATDTTLVTTAAANAPQAPGLPVLSPPTHSSSTPDQMDRVGATMNEQPVAPTNPTGDLASTSTLTALPTQSLNGVLRSEAITQAQGGILPYRGPRSTMPRSISSQRRLSTPSQKSADTQEKDSKKPIGTIGVCALDVKARSRPSRQILTRLQGDGEFEVVVFGDKAILDEDVKNWPICDFLIAFFSDGFPLDKAIGYVKLRKPFVVNDLSMQKVLWDRRLCLRILDSMKVMTPRRVEVNRDGGPKLESTDLAQHIKRYSGLVLLGPEDGTGGGSRITKSVRLVDDGDTLVVDGLSIKKPFVEKPINGEDHNIIIYFPKSHEGGGARRLFRKIGNKSSDWDPNLIAPRCIADKDSSYIYEQFLKTENAEDVKAYTVGPDYCHAETRKSPVVDGLVRRNTHGKELRYVTNLSDTEKDMASKVARGFGQRICGFDLLRANGQSYVIDVNGWSFVKDNEYYYDKCADILRTIFSTEKFKHETDIVAESYADIVKEGVIRSNTAGVSTHHSHRSALKTILRSPSLTMLSAHLTHSSKHQAYSAASPRTSMTTPLTSPPSMDRPAEISLPPPPKSVEAEDVLPPAAVQSDSAIEDGPAGEESTTLSEATEPAAAMPLAKHSWKLKGAVTVIRHADRTPKQKIKFTAHSQVFVDLLKGHEEEVLLKGEAALSRVEAAVKVAQQQNLEDQDKLRNLRNALARKRSQPGTKVQIKPMFKKRPKTEEGSGNGVESPRGEASEYSIPEHAEVHLQQSPNSPAAAGEVKRVPTRSDSIGGATFSRYAASDNDMIVEKLQLVMKWGGEPTHSARYQSQDLGFNMRDDYKLLNRKVLDDVRIFTSSEKRVKTSAQIWAGAFTGRDDIPEDLIQVRKDLLDDSNAAKDVMDKVKKKLKHLLREGNSIPEEFAWPKDVPDPYLVMQTVVDLLKFHRRVMRHNFKKLGIGGAAASLAALSASPEGKENSKEAKELISVSSIQSRWCTGEDAELFKERWEKLFAEFCDTDKADPSKISELYDTMKYDALHNKQFLEWVFTPSQSIIDQLTKEESAASQSTSPSDTFTEEPAKDVSRHDSTVSFAIMAEKQSFAQRIGLRRRSVLALPPSTPPLADYEQDASYFKLFSGSGDSKSKHDKRLGRLRELYRYSKILFDFIGPQEYGISDHEKLEIGLLTSLPLLREIVQDLEELQASGDAKFFAYFTKESHIYTLLNCIMEGGIHTKIKRATIPELDYLSQICFELYEATDAETNESTYSIRISISPGCHTVDPLDVSLDSKHAIGSAPRRSLTNHQEYKEVINTLKAKFDTVQLPKSFLTVNVSDKHESDAKADNERGKGAGQLMQEDDARVKSEDDERGRSRGIEAPKEEGKEFDMEG